MEKLLMGDYTASVVVEWFVPRVETRCVASWCPEPSGRLGGGRAARLAVVKNAWMTGGC
jgi:hypothetical protein